ncbi:hypothetical protein GOODEAATRI_000761 [Goodea atripinnis]|uniref:Uncharacterized protein n=1 Tax=Goodea atripinnis TaxID=208336 RepID=A0ABV0NGG3_9TELE
MFHFSTVGRQERGAKREGETFGKGRRVRDSNPGRRIEDYSLYVVARLTPTPTGLRPSCNSNTNHMTKRFPHKLDICSQFSLLNKLCKTFFASRNLTQCSITETLLYTIAVVALLSPWSQWCFLPGGGA